MKLVDGLSLRTKVVAELIVIVLVAIAGAVYLAVRGFLFLRVTLPLWVVALVTTAMLVLVTWAFASRRHLGIKIGVSKSAYPDEAAGTLLEKITFDYPDSPTNHGWRISETSDPSQPTFKTLPDGVYGSVIRIDSTVCYAMDYSVQPVARFGSLVEFSTIPKDAVFYAHVKVTSKDGSKISMVWLQFPVENRPPYFIGGGEWAFPIKPVHGDGSWLVFTVDLTDAVKNTFGKEGWKFLQIEGFRIRGNSVISHIAIFKGTAGKSSWSRIIASISILAALAILLMFGIFVLKGTQQAAAPTAEILLPEVVGMKTPISIKYSNVLLNSRLWLVVKGTDKFWTHGTCDDLPGSLIECRSSTMQPTRNQETGTWDYSEINIGSESEKEAGKVFTVFVILVDTVTDRDLAWEFKTNSEACGKPPWKGRATRPQGTVLKQKDVTRR